SEGRKVVPTDIAEQKLIRLAVSTESSQIHLVGEEIRKRVCLLLKIQKTRIRQIMIEPERVTLHLSRQHDNLFWCGHGQRTKKTIHDTEHRSVDANAQCQRQHGHNREAGILQEHPNSVTKIV